MRIELGVLRARVTAMTPAERTFLHEYLTFSNPKGRFSGQGTTVHMFNVLDDSFPAGLWPMLERAAEEAGLPLDLVDLRGENPAGLTWPSLETELLLDALCPWLRWYQREAVQAAVEKGRGIIWCPTGSGKTVIAGGLVKLLPVRWLFIVNDAGLLHQTADAFEKGQGEWPGIGEPIGRIGDGEWSVERVTVATFQTLYSRRKQPEVAALLEATEGLIADECHTLPAGTFWSVAMRCPAWFRFGLSGTPLARGDKRSSLTIGALGRVIYRITPKVLQEEKVLAVPHLRMVRCEQLPTAKTYAGLYSEAVAGSARRNALLTRMALAAEKPAWLFFRQIDHGRDLLARALKAGMNAEMVYGAHDVRKRQGLVEAQLRGELDLIVCSTVFQTGWNMPELRSVIIGSGDKSIIATLQRIGRGMRVDKASGKETFEVWDVWDEGHPTLDQHTDERYKAYQKEGYQPEIITPALLPPLPSARRRAFLPPPA